VVIFVGHQNRKEKRSVKRVKRKKKNAKKRKIIQTLINPGLAII